MQPDFLFNAFQSLYVFVLAAIMVHSIAPHIILGIDAIFEDEIPKRVVIYAHLEQLEARRVVKYLTSDMLSPLTMLSWIGTFISFGVLTAMTVLAKVQTLGIVTSIVFVISYLLSAWLCKYNSKDAIVRAVTIWELRKKNITLY